MTLSKKDYLFDKARDEGRLFVTSGTLYRRVVRKDNVIAELFSRLLAEENPRRRELLYRNIKGWQKARDKEYLFHLNDARRHYPDNQFILELIEQYNEYLGDKHE